MQHLCNSGWSPSPAEQVQAGRPSRPGICNCHTAPCRLRWRGFRLRALRIAALHAAAATLSTDVAVDCGRAPQTSGGKKIRRGCRLSCTPRRPTSHVGGSFAAGGPKAASTPPRQPLSTDVVRDCGRAHVTSRCSRCPTWTLKSINISSLLPPSPLDRPNHALLHAAADTTLYIVLMCSCPAGSLDLE